MAVPFLTRWGSAQELKECEDLMNELQREDQPEMVFQWLSLALICCSRDLWAQLKTRKSDGKANKGIFLSDLIFKYFDSGNVSTEEVENQLSLIHI